MIDKNNIDIWAIPIHVNENKKQVDAFNFCLNKGIIGIGWETSKTISGNSIDYESIFNNYSNFIGSPKLSSFEKYVRSSEKAGTKLTLKPITLTPDFWGID